MDSVVISPLVAPGALAIALILQYVKKALPKLVISAKIMPWIPVGMGVIAAIASGTGGALINEILNGVLAGLLAAGGYDVVTTTTAPKV